MIVCFLNQASSQTDVNSNMIGPAQSEFQYDQDDSNTIMTLYANAFLRRSMHLKVCSSALTQLRILPSKEYILFHGTHERCEVKIQNRV